MSVVAAYHVFVCALFLIQGDYVDWPVHIPPCTRNNARINISYAATTLIIMEYS